MVHDQLNLKMMTFALSPSNVQHLRIKCCQKSKKKAENVQNLLASDKRRTNPDFVFERRTTVHVEVMWQNNVGIGQHTCRQIQLEDGLCV